MSMTLDTTSHLTRCGLPGIDVVPFGTHACHFYRDRDQLIEALVPYFIAGLTENERCLWITSRPVTARDAIEALRAAWSGADDAIQSGALRIIDFDRWYASASGLVGVEIVDLWLKEEERALAEGYRGLRITGNTSFLTAKDWPGFMEYERAVSERFRGRRIVALCSYELAQCGAEQLSEVMQAHHCAFECADATWQVSAAPKAP